MIDINDHFSRIDDYEKTFVKIWEDSARLWLYLAVFQIAFGSVCIFAGTLYLLCHEWIDAAFDLCGLIFALCFFILVMRRRRESIKRIQTTKDDARELREDAEKLEEVLKNIKACERMKKLIEEGGHD